MDLQEPEHQKGKSSRASAGSSFSSIRQSVYKYYSYVTGKVTFFDPFTRK
jgi:hypothetical protein